MLNKNTTKNDQLSSGKFGQELAASVLNAQGTLKILKTTACLAQMWAVTEP